jgi:hypothetical protein
MGLPEEPAIDPKGFRESSLDSILVDARRVVTKEVKACIENP